MEHYYANILRQLISHAYFVNKNLKIILKVQRKITKEKYKH